MFNIFPSKKVSKGAAQRPPSPTPHPPERSGAESIKILKEFRAEAEARGEDVNVVARQFLEQYKSIGQPPLIEPSEDAPQTPPAAHPSDRTLSTFAAECDSFTNACTSLDTMRDRLADRLLGDEPEAEPEENPLEVLQMLQQLSDEQKARQETTPALPNQPTKEERNYG